MKSTEKMLFTFYPDEISFQAQDFIGLTEEEGGIGGTQVPRPLSPRNRGRAAE